MSRCASAEVVEPAVAPARRRNRASRAASKRIERGEVMYYIVTYALQRFEAGWRAPRCPLVHVPLAAGLAVGCGVVGATGLPVLTTDTRNWRRTGPCCR